MGSGNNLTITDMGEILILAQRCRLSPGDLLGLAREAAEDCGLRSVYDLTEFQRDTLVAVLRLLAAPIRLEDYIEVYC